MPVRHARHISAIPQQLMPYCLPLQAASLFRSFRDFKRREAAGLLSLYTGRLAAQQRALLVAREEVFAIPADAATAEAAHIVERCTQLELEVS